MASSGRWRWVLLALGATALGFLALAALGLIFGRQWLVKPGWSSSPAVQFRQPFSGQEVGLNDELPIYIRLSPSEEVGHIELWIDGELSDALDLEDSPDTRPSEVAFTWRPGEAGPHVLVARAADQAGRIGISRPVIVKVTEDQEEPWVVSETVDAGETVESIAGALGLTPEEILAANPEVGASPAVGIELSIPVSRDRLPAGYIGDDAQDPDSAPLALSPEPALALGGEGEGQATEVSVASPRRLPNGLAWNLGNPSLPTAPQQITLTASGGCTVEVRFSDDSLSEAGFRVYRWGPASSDFYPVAELGPNRASETLVFQDQVPFPGLHLYYVAAVNAWGEAPGAMAPVEISGEGCIPEQPAQGDRTFPLQLEVLELVTTPAGSLDSAYCYVSLSFLGASHLRLPAGEDTFFTRQGEGWNIADHAAGPGRFAFRQPVDQSIPFGMECWGWAGDDLISLGDFEVDLSPEAWLRDLPQVFTGEGTGPEGNGFQASYRISLFLPEGLEFVPVDYCPAPCDSEFPAPYDLNIADTTDECIEGHVNLAGGDLGDGAVAAEWACLELDPDQMLTWEWDETAGVPRSQTQGFQVWTYPSAYAWRNGDVGWIDSIGSAAQVMPRRMPPCDGEYVYHVRAYLYYEQADGGLIEIRSSPSNAIGVQGPACPEYRATVDLRLNSLVIDDSSDVDGLEALCFFCDEDVTQEAYGLLRVTVVHEGTEAEVGRIVLWDEICGTVGGINACGGERTRGIRDGDYDLTQETMTSCETTPDGTWDCTSHERDRSRVAFPVYDGDQIWVYLTLLDHDTGTGDDIFCSGMETGGPINMDADYWQEGSQRHWVIYDDNSEASCRLSLDSEVISRTRIPLP